MLGGEVVPVLRRELDAKRPAHVPDGPPMQAFAKWIDAGSPAHRAPDVADVAVTTDLLDRYLRRDRIPAVVRRSAPALGGTSLLALVEKGRFRKARTAVEQMFDLRRVQP